VVIKMPDLTGLPALDVAIGLSFIFLLLSLLASAIQEFIAGIFGLRARTLERGLRNMLEGGDGSVIPGGAAPGPAGTLVDAVYLHPLIRPLYKAGFGFGARREGRRLPSYIAPRSFALALLDTLAPDVVGTNADGTPKPSHDVVHEARTAIAGASLPPEVQRRILALLDDARGDIDGFRHNLEAWFDDTMARVSGWYKRKTQIILLVIGVVVAIAINANTLTMGERLWKDPAVRGAVVGQATSVSDSPRTAGDLNAAANAVDGVVKLGVPMGWPQDANDPRHVSFRSVRDGAYAVLGWALTIIAIALGAPFWFDTLSRLSRLRSSGKPETPLPATGRGQPNERVVDPTTQPAPVPPVNVTVVNPAGGGIFGGLFGG
jgi:hypothetical protein